MGEIVCSSTLSRRNEASSSQTHKYQVSIQPEKLHCSIKPSPRDSTLISALREQNRFQMLPRGHQSRNWHQTSRSEWRVCGDSRITDVFGWLTDIPLSSFCPYPAIRPQHVSHFFTICYICNILFSQLEDKVTVIVPLQIYYYSIYLLILTNVHKRWLLIQQWPLNK